MNTLGIDIGGTWIKYAVIADDDVVRLADRTPTAASYPDLLNQLTGLVADMHAGHDVGGGRRRRGRVH